MRGQFDLQSAESLKQERVKGQYEQLIHTLEHENECLKYQKDEYHTRLDELSGEIEHLKKLMSEVLTTQPKLPTSESFPMRRESTLSFAAQTMPTQRNSSRKKVDVSVSPRSFRERVSSRDMYSDKEAWHSRFTRQMQSAVVISSKGSIQEKQPHPSFTAVQSSIGASDDLINKSA